MPRRTKFDLDTLRKLVHKGLTRPEIMAEMKISNHPTFNNLMLKLMDTDKKYYQLKESGKAKNEKPVTVKIGKRNTLTLSTKILNQSSFQPGTIFQVGFTNKKITLTAVD
jgi:hypothetical protein